MAGPRGRLKALAAGWTWARSLRLLLLLAGALAAVALGQPCGGAGDGGAVPWVHRALLSPFSPDARPPLKYTKAFVAFEVCVFTFAVVVLSLSLVMFLRLYDALSPPTKTLVGVVAANLVMAVASLLFTFEKIYFLVRGDGYVPTSERLCRYIHPVGRAAMIYMWCGMPIMAWVTLQTIRNEYVPPAKLRRWSRISLALSLYFLVMAEVFSQGIPVWGSFCAVPPIYADRIDGGLGFHNGLQVPNRLLDPRLFHVVLGFTTLSMSMVIYYRAHRHLAAFNKRWKRDLEERRQQHLEAERFKNSHLQLPPPQRAWFDPYPWSTSGSGSSGPGSSAAGPGNHSSSDAARVEAALRQGFARPWRRQTAATPGRSTEGEGAVQQSRAWSSMGEEGVEWGDEESEGSVYSDMSRDSDDPVSLAEMQERARAAQRAAAFMLMAAPQQHVQQQRSPAPPMEPAAAGPVVVPDDVVVVDVEAPPPPQQQHRRQPRVVAGTPEARSIKAGGWSHPVSVAGSDGGYMGDAEDAGQQRRGRVGLVGLGDRQVEADPVHFAGLLHKASRTLFNRAIVLLCAYYLPYVLIMLVLIKYKGGPPPIEILSTVMACYILSSPVLQALILVQVAVRIGANILKFREGEEQEERERQQAVDAAEGATAGEQQGPQGHEENGPEAAAAGAVAPGPGPAQHVELAGGGGGQRPPPPQQLSTPATVGSERAAHDFGRPQGGFAYERGASELSSDLPPLEQQQQPPQPPMPYPPPIPRRTRGPYPPLSASAAAASSRRRHQRAGGLASGASPGGGARRMQALATIYEVAFRNRGKDAAAAIAAAAGNAGDKGGAGSGSAGAGGGGSGVGSSNVASGTEAEEDGDSWSAAGKAQRTVGTSLLQETLGVSLAPSSGSGSGSASSASGESKGESSGGADTESSLAPSSSADGGGLRGLPRAIRGLFPLPLGDRGVGSGGGERGGASSAGLLSEVSSLTDTTSYQDGAFAPVAARVMRRGRRGPSPGTDDARGEGQEEGKRGERGGSPVQRPMAGISTAGAGDSGGGGLASASAPLPVAAAAAAAFREADRSAHGRAHSSTPSVTSSVDTDDGGRSIVTESDWRAWQQEQPPSGESSSS